MKVCLVSQLIIIRISTHGWDGAGGPRSILGSLSFLFSLVIIAYLFVLVAVKLSILGILEPRGALLSLESLGRIVILVSLAGLVGVIFLRLGYWKHNPNREL